jgi:CO/xanthine dehydrogenase Mo-binding subunit
MPDLNWALEEQMDLVAHKLGLDPVAFRERHILKEGETNCLGQPTHSIGAEACLQKATRAINWGKPLKKEQFPWKRGRGVAVGCQSTPTHPPSYVHAKVHPDGTIELRFCAIEQGQGTDTVMAQIASEVFGIPVEKIKIVPKDTEIVPFGPRTGGSRQTFYVGNATWRACEDAKRQVFELAAHRLEASPHDLETSNGKITVKGSPRPFIEIGELFSPMGFVPGLGEILGKGEFSVQGKPLDPKSGHSERWAAFYGYGAYAVEVAVDVETGEVRVEKVSGCCDMGRPINPKMCEQQMEGAIGQGIGLSLYEELVVEKGLILNPGFADYKMPTSLEMPKLEDIERTIGAVPHEDGPFGAKGFGEAALTPFYAALGNAFFNATGVRICDLPLTKEKVFKALREKG